MKFDIDTIDEYQLEITTYCNAACPQCPRNLNGYGINPYMPLTHLSRSAIDLAFTDELCNRIRQIFFCGSYGDPIMHPNFLDILRDFRRKNPTIWLYMHTNGGVHDAEYWAEIAKIMNGYGQIDFGIDGVGDTLQLYRKNVKYTTVIENAQAFINAGGRAQWNFIVFEHNEKEIATAEKISKDLGFNNILFRRTGRFWHHGEERELDSWPIKNKSGVTEYDLRPPKLIQYRNPSTHRIKEIKQQHGSFKNYLKQTPIHCDSLMGKKVAVNAEGLVLPCNFFNHNLYDARFKDRGQLPGSNDVSFVNGKNQVAEFVDRYRHSIDINNNSLEEVFQSEFWTELVNGWGNDNRIMECAMTCGEKFTKVWDQGGSNR